MGEVHMGKHTSILDRELFEAVQSRLAQQKVRRKLARSKSSAILMGLIFDDRGHPMSPSHVNKKGVRYRYYVSHALLQNGKPTQVRSPACTVHPNELEIIFRRDEDGAEAGTPTCLSIPFTPNLVGKKGITHAPADRETIDSRTRDALLQAIGRVRGWLDSILSGNAASFDDIARGVCAVARWVRVTTAYSLRGR